MVKIDKPDQIPEILVTKGNPATKSNCEAYNSHRTEFDSGVRVFKFYAAIYSDESVKRALIIAQHGKCCFCERRIGLDGDVEHFRPKGGFCQSRKDPVVRPGYYWLAYDWSNLLLSCGPCNQRHKRNLFPLADPSRRALCHEDDVSLEEPSFINPGTEDPENHIGFRGEVPYAKRGSPRGRETIKSLGIDRIAINEIRREHLKKVKDMLQVLTRLKAKCEGEEQCEIRDKIAEYIRTVTDRSAEFASATRSSVSDAFEFIR